MEKLNLKKLDVTIYPHDLSEIGLFIFTFKEPSRIYLVRGYEYELKKKKIEKRTITYRKVNKNKLICRYFLGINGERVSDEDFVLIYPFSIWEEIVGIYSIDDIEKFK